MSETIADHITVEIQGMLDGLSSTSSKPSMFRVGDRLRRMKPEAYDPEIIAIGPFHREKPNLQNMEQHKLRYLRLFLQRRNESVKRCVTIIIQHKDMARECCAEDIHFDDAEFVKMLILDGCFIVEFLLRFQQEPADRDDPIFQNGHMRSQLFHDLMLFENQIPFFIIDILLNMNKTDDEDIESLIIRPLLENSIFAGLVKEPPKVPRSAHHLLGIVHHNLCSSFANVASGDGDPHNIAKTNPAVGLEKAGISFQRSEYRNSFRIEFENKVMKIPEWKISDSTETLFRNLMAYEHYLTGSPQKYVTDYAFFMHCLVKSPEDANVLQRSHIITNFSGSDEMNKEYMDGSIKARIFQQSMDSHFGLCCLYPAWAHPYIDYICYSLIP
ncbi:UPF0481 protein At3g47200-like [Olea europaea var. sylvestris]|uniref:UPF0481 protein At3g47200-like n=1 Tax=Olea europaea var. sylvestris TaxID=158386 RepID=UPI000C1CE14A|nr:UPF0481 protein At3g47200-like [Olea europaea var. sylvestris]